MELADNVGASIYLPDGSYEKQDLRGKTKVNSQMQFVKEAEAAAREAADPVKKGRGRTFVPAR